MEQPNTKIWHLPLAVLAAVVLSACGKTEQTSQQQHAAKVSVAEVIEQPINEWDEFTGRLEAPESVEIRPRVSGFIDKVAFAEGSLVKKGDLLFQIDPRPFNAEVKRLEAQLNQARSAYARTRSEAQRGERLRKSNAISAELADARTSSAQEAQANVAGIQAELDNARLNLSFTRVISPIDGRVSRAEITAGNLVTASESLLTSVVSTDKVYAYFDADEQTFLKYVDLAQKAGKNTRDASPVYLGLSNESDFPHLGKLDFLDNQVNPQTGTIRGRAVFDNSQGEYTPGLYARLKLVGSNTYSAMLIQDEAVGTDLGKKFVLVLADDNTVNYRAIELGPKVEGLRVVRSGLAKGDKIVVNGLQHAMPGSTVDPQKVAMADEETLASLARIRQQVDSTVNTAEGIAERPAQPNAAPRG
ncbi:MULTISPECIES: multidrug efflux RND transporter periplasmic adaptor subunit MexE [Pseudomonas]|jgi:multidrug efflux system membrane fusion protein|uniref:Efflux transporter periplasmic adaptor subunit n=1 Tax=Pseudomonas marincola TaxID=437900 RepID=A0A1I6YIR2_9PSED|nr:MULTISPECIES: efflux RND transporter periplasmic adaptor subunit [Pseudomonas]MBQ55783.1 efflux RND transporter periplasmic adaptor subunit [Pseudomonadaceae bacterium]NRH28957.1 efflux RND transporter periplasmic adaptor subunit [Pseudomonas sp. MS19]OEO26680.1 efflux transporter periplasmic adaptor subunit [Pseudomonas sp. J237]CAE6933526.1 Efflux RND transporter periplasmic adaptor subunit [Pseudomonas marincola]SFT50385.1 membrane fusion protein, multidrug efflux system [Pseudomonas mar